MAEESDTTDTLPADGSSLVANQAAGSVGEESDADAPQSGGRRKKMLIILGVAVLAGTIIGIASTLLISSLKPSPKSQASAPTSSPNHQQEALIQDLKTKNQALETQVKQAAQVPPPEAHPKPSEHAISHDDSDQLKELKAKNEKLEEQLKLSQQAPPPVRHEPTPTLRGKAAGAKVAEDCTITDKTEKLGEKLKSCVDDFNSSTR